MPDRVTGPVVLMVDDDRSFLASAREFLEDKGYAFLGADTSKKGEAICATQKVDLVLLDQCLPDGSGADLCAKLLTLQHGLKIIFMTAYPSFEIARAAVQAGAYDYLSKPFEPEALALSVSRALRVSTLERAARARTFQHRAEADCARIVGEEEGMRSSVQAAMQAAWTDAPVLITGETGTGKGLLARFVHYSGPARSGPFLAVNCAAIPESLFESELFGCEKGTYTGAAAAREGLLETASGGTLFLDEVGEIPVSLQAKLLGAIEDRTIRRLGGRAERPIDARIIAATNIDLAAAVKAGCFRRDLFFRLNVLPIHIPPLRDRREDIPLLCEHLLSELRPNGSEPFLSTSEIRALCDYSWPGNVRELRNVLERALLHSGPDRDLSPSRFLSGIDSSVATADEALANVDSLVEITTLEEMERRHLAMALDHFQWNLARTSRALGISLSTLKRKVRRVPRRRDRPSAPVEASADQSAV